MSQERRRLLASHRFDVVNSEPLETDGSTALAPMPKQPSLLQRWFGGRKKVDVTQEDPQIVEFKEAVSAIGVDLDAQLSRPPLFANTNNVRVLPVLMKQAEDVHPYDEEQVAQTVRIFNEANAKLPEHEKLPISIIADGLVTGNKGKVTEYEAEDMPFQAIPSEADVKVTENGLYAYQVVQDRVIRFLPSAETENRLAVIQGNQLVVTEKKAEDDSKALSTVVVIRRNAKPIEEQQSVAEIAESVTEQKNEDESKVLETPNNLVDFGPFVTPIAQGQIQRLDLNGRKAG